MTERIDVGKLQQVEREKWFQTRNGRTIADRVMFLQLGDDDQWWPDFLDDLDSQYFDNEDFCSGASPEMLQSLLEGDCVSRLKLDYSQKLKTGQLLRELGKIEAINHLLVLTSRNIDTDLQHEITARARIESNKPDLEILIVNAFTGIQL